MTRSPFFPRGRAKKKKKKSGKGGREGETIPLFLLLPRSFQARMDVVDDGIFQLSDVEVAILEPGMRRKQQQHQHHPLGHFTNSQSGAAVNYIAATAGAKATRRPQQQQQQQQQPSSSRADGDPFNPQNYAPRPAASHSIRRTVNAVGDIVVFIVVAAASFLGSAILRQVTEIWPDNILVFVCAIEILIIAHYIIGALHYVLQWHANRDWVDGWTRVFNFIMSALLLIPAYYVVTMIFNLFGHSAITAPQVFLVSTAAITSGAFIAALLMHGVE